MTDFDLKSVDTFIGRSNNGFVYPHGYKDIEVLYDQNGFISPLQRWNNMLIDLDKIEYISDAYIIRDPFSGCDNKMIQFEIKFASQTNTIFRFKCNERTKILENLSDEEKEKIRNDFKYSLYNKRFYMGTGYFEYYEEPEIDKDILQRIVVNDLQNVWKKYKEKIK